MNLTRLSSIAMVCIASMSTASFAAGVSGDNAQGLDKETQMIQKMTIASDCQPVIHYPMGKKPANPNSTTYAVQLLPPQDSGFHEKMGGDMSQASMLSFHNATGTMFVVANTDGSTDITFDFYGLFPLGVYSLWNVTNPNYDTGEFSDGPLPDESGETFPVNPGFLGAPEGYGNHGFKANKCGSANFTIHMNGRPGKEFLLDFHGNGFLPGVKGETVFPGVLWGKFPEFG